jgi:hypothetical protein
MIIRLFQRAGAIGAASVALFVSLIGTAYALTAPQVNVYGVDTVTNADGHFEARYHFQRRFASNDPTYPGKVDYVTRKIRVEKRGNPMKWVKRTGLEVAVIGAVAAAGYAIDELTNQVTHLAPDPASGYQEGYVWGTRTSPRYATPAEAFPHMFPGYPDSTIFHVHSVTDCGYSGKYFTCRVSGTGTVDGHVSDLATPVYRGACTDCPEAPKIAVPLEYDQVWDIVNEVADTNPDALQSWATDAAGNPYIYPEVAAEHAKIIPDVTGAPALPDAVVVNDPLEGQGLDSTGMPVAESPTPEVVAETAPIQFPNDYARENTLSDIRDVLKNEKHGQKEADYKPVQDEFKKIEDKIAEKDAPLGVLPSFDIPVAFNGAASCKGFSFDFGAGPFAMHFETDKHCEIARDIINPMLSFIFALMAGWYVWTVYREETTRGF